MVLASGCSYEMKRADMSGYVQIHRLHCIMGVLWRGGHKKGKRAGAWGDLQGASKKKKKGSVSRDFRRAY